MTLDAPSKEASPLPREIINAPARQRRLLTSPYARCLALLAVVYLVVYGWLLFSTDFFPYVMDNNESFSSLWHASNIYNFGISQTFGLTDESFSPHAEAHPYVHTHQGNFPRLFSFLIYVGGARSVEAQIAVTTFTIGAAAIFFAFHFFSRIASPYLALAVCIVFVTDYVFYAQWNVVTYRVWHAFFVFSTLLCIRGIGTRQRRLWTALTCLNSLGLFYFEYVFVAFVSLLAASYAFLIFRRAPRVAVTSLGAYLAGAVVSMLVLVIQLAAYLGWRGVLTDIYVTYVARNAAEDPQLLRQIHDFYVSHHVAFWYNFVDSSGLRTPGMFAGLLFSFGFQVLTPLLSLLVFMLAFGGLLGLLRPQAPRWLGSLALRPWARIRDGTPAWLVRRDVGNHSTHSHRVMGGGLLWKNNYFTFQLAASLEISSREWFRGRHWFTRPVPLWLLRRRPWLGRLLMLWLAFEVLFAVVLRDHAFDGVPSIAVGPVWQTGGFGTLAACVGAVVVCIVLHQVGGGTRLRFQRIGWYRFALSAGLVLASTYFVTHQWRLYNQATSAFWFTHVEGTLPDYVGRAAVIATATLAGAVALVGTERMLGRRFTRDFSGLMMYVSCVFIAYSGAYLLVPGYVYSGYLVRYAPLTVFFTDALVASAGYVAVGVLWRAVLRLRRARRPIRARVGNQLMPASARRQLAAGFMRQLQPIALIVVAAGLSTFLVAYWGFLQRSYVQLLPATHFLFLKALSRPPFLGASFVVSQYSAPVAAYTDQWAYYDPAISAGQITLTDNGYHIEHDLDTYLWLADRLENRAYQEPDYYVCMIPQTFDTVLHRLEPDLGIGANSDCASFGIVKLARGERAGPLQPELVAEDSLQRDYWAILKLDWDYPPYLARRTASDTDSRVELMTHESRAGTALAVDYTYSQQGGKPEDHSILRVYSVSQTGGSPCLLQEAYRAGELKMLPATFQGYIRVSVTPRSSTKTGEEYLSSVTRIGNPASSSPAGCR